VDLGFRVLGLRDSGFGFRGCWLADRAISYLTRKLDATFARDNTTKGFFMFQACLVGNLGGVSHCLTVARTVVLRNSVV